MKFKHTSILINKLSRKLDATQLELAKHVGVTPQFFGRLKNGSAGVPADIVLKLAIYCEVDPLLFVKAAAEDFKLRYMEKM